MAPGTEVKPPMISTGSAFSATHVSANCTPLRAPHSMPATSATTPAVAQTSIQICLQRNADRQRRRVVVGDRAQAAPDLGAREEQRQRRHHDAGDRRRREVELADEHAGLVHHPVDRLVLDAEIEARARRRPRPAAPRLR